MKFFVDVLVVLDFVNDDGGSGILAYFKSYEFVFYLQMMYDILHLTGVTPPNLNGGNVRGRMTSCGSVTNEYIVKKAIQPSYI